MINFSVDLGRAGKGKLIAQLVASDGTVKALTIRESSGIYTIREQFTVTGSWRLIVLYNGRELLSVPVEVRRAPEPNKCIADHLLLRDGYWNVGDNVQLKIDCTDAGGGELEVKINNPYGAEIPSTKSVDTTGGRRIYVLTIVPDCEGVYSIVCHMGRQKYPR